VTLVEAYAYGRLAFGGAALAAPVATGRLLAGEGAATPDAAAFLRGMGGREIGIGLGVLRAGHRRRVERAGAGQARARSRLRRACRGRRGGGARRNRRLRRT
jgi:hypothetical protein